MLIRSTSPAWPATSATSPTAIVSSIRMNQPVITSCTSFCDAEPDREADHARAGEQRRDVDADLRQHDHRDENHQDDLQ